MARVWEFVFTAGSLYQIIGLLPLLQSTKLFLLVCCSLWSAVYKYITIYSGCIYQPRWIVYWFFAFFQVVEWSWDDTYIMRSQARTLVVNTTVSIRSIFQIFAVHNNIIKSEHIWLHVETLSMASTKQLDYKYFLLQPMTNLYQFDINDRTSCVFLLLNVILSWAFGFLLVLNEWNLWAQFRTYCPTDFHVVIYLLITLTKSPCNMKTKLYHK